MAAQFGRRSQTCLRPLTLVFIMITFLVRALVFVDAARAGDRCRKHDDLVVRIADIRSVGESGPRSRTTEYSGRCPGANYSVSLSSATHRLRTLRSSALCWRQICAFDFHVGTNERLGSDSRRKTLAPCRRTDREFITELQLVWWASDWGDHSTYYCTSRRQPAVSKSVTYYAFIWTPVICLRCENRTLWLVRESRRKTEASFLTSTS